jgi:hypothetical protein
MKRFMVLALMFVVASCVFAAGPQAMASSHAQTGYDYKDVTIVVTVSPADQGTIWLNARYSYPLLLAEADKLQELVQTAEKRINIAVANKSSISYVQEVGRFHTKTEAIVAVSFETHGYDSSYAVVRIRSEEKNVVLLLDRKDTRDFINILGNTHGLVDDYQRQVALFK